MMSSKTMNVSIERDPSTVYDFVLNLENLPKWASTAFQSIKEQDGEWSVDTRQGSAKVRITKKTTMVFWITMLFYHQVWKYLFLCEW